MLLPFALAACSAGSPQQAATAAPAQAAGSFAAGPLDACALVSQAEAEAALGVTLAAPRHDGLSSEGDAETAAASTCRYDASDPTSPSASVFIRRAAGDENTPAAIAATRSSVEELAQSELTDVNDLGDTAFWGAGQLNVFSGSRYYLIVSVNGAADDAGALAAARRLAEAALARL